MERTDSSTRFECLQCGWSARTRDGLARHDLNTAAIEHYGETGHTVEAVPASEAPERDPDTGWANEWPPE